MVRPYRFSLEEFFKLPLPERGVELLKGELYQMAPIGSRHADLVDRWAEGLMEAFRGRARVRVQGPFVIPPDTYLEPDLLLLKPKAYWEGHPTPEDALLVVEVAESSLEYDLNKKIPLYARGGVPEVWVQDLAGRRLLLFREPRGDHYREQLWLSPGEKVAPLAFPETLLEIPW
ncbi:Uma2 family endonuclease [Thermus oshimai]|uniref:Uma2 family endonuclease n=1 Tax=Thermus oshimai TaxID=56957 RepID=UPI0039A6918C